jgi:hypothetical protein
MGMEHNEKVFPVHTSSILVTLYGVSFLQSEIKERVFNLNPACS